MSQTQSLTLTLIEDLQLRLLQHRYRYYVLCAPTLTDRQYDRMERDLKDLVDKRPGEASTSRYKDYYPTITVGSDMADSYPPEAHVAA